MAERREPRTGLSRFSTATHTGLGGGGDGEAEGGVGCPSVKDDSSLNVEISVNLHLTSDSEPVFAEAG